MKGDKTKKETVESNVPCIKVCKRASRVFVENLKE